MKTNNILPVVLHSAIILFVQIFLLIGFSFSLWDKFVAMALIYPLIIILLPLSTNKSLVLILAFMIGIIIDFFYDSPGVHTGALVFTAFLRSTVLRQLEPRGGYRTDNIPSVANYGLTWFLKYSGILLSSHIVAYFILDIFTFVYIDKIIVNTFITFAISYVFILIYQMAIRQ